MSIKFKNIQNKDVLDLTLKNNCVIKNFDPKKDTKSKDVFSLALSAGQTKSVNLQSVQYKLLEALARANECDTDDNEEILSEKDLKLAKQRYKTDLDVFKGLNVVEFRYDEKAGIANITTKKGDVLRIDLETKSEKAEKNAAQKGKQSNSNTAEKSNKKPKGNGKSAPVSAKVVKNAKKSKSSVKNQKKSTPQKVSKSGKGTDAFLLALANKESACDYRVMNKYGFVGAYQVGEEALHDVGVYYETEKMGINYKKNDWKGYIAGDNKYGIKSLSDFRSSPSKQKAVQIDFKKKHWQYLKNLRLTGYIGKTINGIYITESGLLAGAHLVGPGGVKLFLQSNGKLDVKDKNGTKVSSYIKKFAGYNIKEITRA